MMMMMMMMMMCKRLAQVPMLCVPIYNMKLAIMQKKTFLSRIQHIRRWPPTSAGKSRCLPVILPSGNLTYIAIEQVLVTAMGIQIIANYHILAY